MIKFIIPTVILFLIVLFWEKISDFFYKKFKVKINYIAIIFLILGLINSKILSPFNKLWFRFGLILGKIISPLIMGIIFFFVVTPTGYVMRFLRKDILNLKYNNNKSYWIEKNNLKSNMKNQF